MNYPTCSLRHCKGRAMRLELGARQPEDTTAAMLELEPHEGQIGIRGREPRIAVADLDEQRAVRLEVTCCAGEDASHDVETIGACTQREIRLVSVFARQLGHLGFAHVGRV